MKRTTMIGFAALMGLAVLAPIAASADDCRNEVVVRPRQEKVIVEYRHDDHGRDWKDYKRPERVERVRFENNKRDCR